MHAGPCRLMGQASCGPDVSIQDIGGVNRRGGRCERLDMAGGVAGDRHINLDNASA